MEQIVAKGGHTPVWFRVTIDYRKVCGLFTAMTPEEAHQDRKATASGSNKLSRKRKAFGYAVLKSDKLRA
jgi:hypothetical protein